MKMVKQTILKKKIHMWESLPSFKEKVNFDPEDIIYGQTFLLLELELKNTKTMLLIL